MGSTSIDGLTGNFSTLGTRKGLTAYPGRIPIGPRNLLSAITTRTATSHNSRMWVQVAEPVASVEFVYSNFGATTSDLTVRAAIENPAGTYTSVYFTAGRDATIKYGSFVKSNPVVVDVAAAGGFWVRTYVTTSGTNTLPLNGAVDTANTEGQEDGTSDKTTSGTISTSYQYMYGPNLILGTPLPTTPNNPIIYGIGDSITEGQGDASLDMGYLVRALRGVKTFFKTGIPGAGANSGELLQQYTRAFCEGATHATVLYGTNDLTSADASTMQARLLTIYNSIAAKGMKVYGCTIPPRTTSTDNWATTANQTPYNSTFGLGSSSGRAQVNDWIRSLPSPLTGYFDLADALESSRNSGYWVVNGSAGFATADGVHPSQAGHFLMAAKINPAVFTV